MHELHIALYQPDIPGNTGTIIRMATCLGLTVEIIEPAGFDLSDRGLRRAGMDYLKEAVINRHVSWDAFTQWRNASGRKLVLMTTAADTAYTDYAFGKGDILLFGRETSGVPPHVHEAADVRLIVPMIAGQRSLNLAVSAAMVTGEAMRQVRQSTGIQTGDLTK